MVCKSLLPAAGLAAVMAASPMEPPAPPPSTLVGITVPSKMALVSPEQAGKIVELVVRDGERVTTESVLFRLNSTLEELEVERLEALANSDLLERRAKMTLRVRRATGEAHQRAARPRHQQRTRHAEAGA